MGAAYIPGLSPEAQNIRDQYFLNGTIPDIDPVKWNWLTPWADGSVLDEVSSKIWGPIVPVVLVCCALAVIIYAPQIKKALK